SDAMRAAAEETTRRLQFLAWARRELGASLDLETGMQRLLEMLVPARGDLALAAVRLERRDIVMSVCGLPGVGAYDSLAALPETLQRAVERASREQRTLDVPMHAAEASTWPPELIAAKVVPLTAGDRNVGALVLGATGAFLADGTIEELAG